ncbi:MAG: glycine oxidase ThiO [Acidimicrobiia bacterium]|nr:glycine oxidase ThiO [Acidimicrobiia bacterium]MYC57764.1 glycine oxidase ThiO [Acidimicrobiia bacterium]MYG93447.1 glycine oxidase ThiO [Acidimicrobiia bacterium]MYI31313.1 glycine oxidase ThiO [Acidimicrobiia bacterium]
MADAHGALAATQNPKATSPEAIVVGGGIIGLSVAWKLQSGGIKTVVFDPYPGLGASHAAAGMLAPVNEAYWGEHDVLRLHLAANQAWPEFAAILGANTVDYRRDGMLRVAFNSDDKAQLAHFSDLYRKENLPVELLRSQQCHELEPLLSPGVQSGIYSPLDHHVNPRLVVAELVKLVPIITKSVKHVTHNQIVTEDGQTMHCRQVVVAAGAWTGKLLNLPIRPVKGQIIRLKGKPGLLHRPVLGLVRGAKIYAIPRSDGEIVVGATQEEMGFDTRVTAGGVYELLRDMLALCPGLSEMELAETWAGLRPGSPDNAPIIGRGHDDIIFASGHFRNGVLTAPITANCVTALIQEQDPPIDLTAFSPDRFMSTPI